MKDKDKERRNDQTLPDDMHFSSRQLVTLFLKPQFSVRAVSSHMVMFVLTSSTRFIQLKMRGRHVQPRVDGEIDENFWAQAAAEQAAGRAGEEGDDCRFKPPLTLPLRTDCHPSATGDGGIPFSTQFFHDDFDEAGGFDDVFDGAEGATGSAIEPGEQDLLAATQGLTRRVRPEFVNYAKRAKRVDVRKLKENIWKGLDIVVPKAEDQDEEEDAMVWALLCAGRCGADVLR